MRTKKGCIFTYISSFLNNVFCSKLNKNRDNTLDLSVSNPIISVYRYEKWVTTLGEKKNIFPTAYCYPGCTIQTDTCSHVYDCTASCNRPAKVIYRLGAIKRKATEVSQHRKHLVRAQTTEQLCLCTVKGFGYSGKYTDSARNCCN